MKVIVYGPHNSDQKSDDPNWRFINLGEPIPPHNEPTEFASDDADGIARAIQYGYQQVATITRTFTSEEELYLCSEGYLCQKLMPNGDSYMWAKSEAQS